MQPFLEDRPSLAPAYSWAKTLWKGLRPVVTAVIFTAVGTLVEKLLDVDLLVKSGVPQFLAIGLVEAGRNFWKQHRA